MMNTKNIYHLHKWSGFIAGLFILMLGITGAVLTFHQELEALEYKKYKTVKNTHAVSIDNALQRINKRYSGWDIRLQQFSPDPQQALVFQLRRPLERKTLIVHPSSGVILKTADEKDSTVFWILKLHYSLHAGLFGEIIVLIVGLFFILSLISGAVIYRKSIVKVLTFNTRFVSHRKRTLASSLHRYVGVWALLLNLLMATTGGLISYEIIKKNLQKEHRVRYVNQTIPFSVDSILQVLKTKQPDFNASYIRFPFKTSDPIVVAGSVKDQAYFYSKYYKTINVDVKTAEITDLQINRNISSLVRGIHFIEYGNVLVKSLFCLVGISGPALAITGFLLWKWKKKKRRIPGSNVTAVR